MNNTKLAKSASLLLALVVFTCAGAYASIEREPVKVDHRNAGPRYDIEELERTRVLSENQNPESNQVMTAPLLPPRQRFDSNNNNDRDDNSHQDAPMISIRRIFLVPMMSSPSSSSSSNDQNDNERPPTDALSPFVFSPSSLFNPFTSSRRLFGGDEASRPAASPMNPDESQERRFVSSASSSPLAGDEQERPRPSSALFDPIEMLMEAMRQALNPANMMPQPQTPEDLNKEASGDNKPTTTGNTETGLEGPAQMQPDKKPQSFNSTKEDIVEIEGKKYLRKTVINRHVGDGIMFMTRRLIFSPLNETDSTMTTPVTSNSDTTGSTTIASAGTTTTTTTTTTSEPSTEPASTSKAEKIDEPIDSSTTTVAPAASEPVSTKEPIATETPSSPSPIAKELSPVASEKEDTTAKSPIDDKVPEFVSKVERLLEKMTERKTEESNVSTEKSSA